MACIRKVLQRDSRGRPIRSAPLGDTERLLQAIVDRAKDLEREGVLQRSPKPVFTRIDAEMSDERIRWNLIDVLLKSGFTFSDESMEFHRRGPYAQPEGGEA